MQAIIPAPPFLFTPQPSTIGLHAFQQQRLWRRQPCRPCISVFFFWALHAVIHDQIPQLTAPLLLQSFIFRKLYITSSINIWNGFTKNDSWPLQQIGNDCSEFQSIRKSVGQRAYAMERLTSFPANTFLRYLAFFPLHQMQPASNSGPCRKANKAREESRPCKIHFQGTLLLQHWRTRSRDDLLVPFKLGNKLAKMWTAALLSCCGNSPYSIRFLFTSRRYSHEKTLPSWTRYATRRLVCHRMAPHLLHDHHLHLSHHFRPLKCCPYPLLHFLAGKPLTFENDFRVPLKRKWYLSLQKCRSEIFYRAFK